MKKLTDKVIEAGIIPDQAVKLMRLWGFHDIESHDTQRQLTQEQLLRMVRDIEELLEQKAEVPELRETDLDIERVFKSEAEMRQVKVYIVDHYVDVYMLVAEDRAGKFIFSREHTKTANIAQPGNRILVDAKVYEIFDVETRYQADKPSFDVCTCKEVPNAAV